MLNNNATFSDLVDNNKIKVKEKEILTKKEESKPVDIDLMLYLKRLKDEKKKLIIQLLIYFPFLILVTSYAFFGHQIFSVFSIHNGLQKLFLKTGNIYFYLN
jgi:hypothetical protein